MQSCMDCVAERSVCVVVFNRRNRWTPLLLVSHCARTLSEAMIRKGTAPAVDYGIKPGDDGRFEIDWNTAKTAPTTDEVGTEIADASADQPAAALPTEAASQPTPSGHGAGDD